MAEVLSGHNRHTSKLGSMSSNDLTVAGPRIEMIPTPDFAFPATPVPSTSQMAASERPVSTHLNTDKPSEAAHSHRTATSTLPRFTFNAADASGLPEDETTPPDTPDENVPTTPTRRGHKRGASEFVGGDSRCGVAGATSLSPTKTSAMPLPVPSSGPAGGRRGHMHRRSGALSSHDVRSVMQLPEAQPRLSSSLPSTPLEHAAQADPFEYTAPAPDSMHLPSDPFGPPLESNEDRPPSRARVGFSEKVEIIPRPLSTVSSETEGSGSTMRGHSVNNSINSVMSLGTPSPPSNRTPRTSSSATVGYEPKPRAQSSLEISKRIEKEGEWLKSRASTQSLERPLSESAASPSKPAFFAPDSDAKPNSVHRKKHSLSHALGLDRRGSEPMILTKDAEDSRMSGISPQEATGPSGELQRAHTVERRSSTRKLKDWAVARITKKSGDPQNGQESVRYGTNERPQTAGSVSVPGKVRSAETPGAETDLDAVFSSQDKVGHPKRLITPPQPSINISARTLGPYNSFQSCQSDDASPMLDLDAALGPFNTPSFGLQRPRRELHSSRLTKDFYGPGGHYHRRIESAPESALPTPEFGRMGTPSTASSLPDVFEGDEDRANEVMESVQPDGHPSRAEEEAGIGIQIVDADTNAPWSRPKWTGDNGLRIRHGDSGQESPWSSCGSIGPRLPTPNMERRASSITDETIPEESSPAEVVEVVDIVEAHEEPRASSVTKSSDSSETPTLLAAPITTSLPESAQSLTTPDTYLTSTFSSPEMGRCQGSFDTSRLGTSASSFTDNRTMSSATTGEHSHDFRISVDDVPSLTSSRSTMMSTMHTNNSRHDFSDRSSSVASAMMNPVVTAERRRKRASIQSLSQLVGGSFSGKSKTVDDLRPQAGASPMTVKPAKKKENRVKKLMFWKFKNQSKQSMLSQP